MSFLPPTENALLCFSKRPLLLSNSFFHRYSSPRSRLDPDDPSNGPPYSNASSYMLLPDRDRKNCILWEEAFDGECPFRGSALMAADMLAVSQN